MFWESSAVFSADSVQKFEVSTQTYLLSFEPDQPIDSPVVAAIVGIQIPDWSLEKQRPNFSFPNNRPPLLPQLHTILLSHFLSSDGQFSFPLKDFVDMLTVIERLHYFLISISSLSIQTYISGNDGFSVWVCTRSPWCCYDCQPIHNLPPVCRGYFQMILGSARWKLCLLLLCACCCLTLLGVEVHQVPRWWRLWWPRDRAVNSGRFRGGWSPCARRWHRRRTWTHNVCLEEDVWFQPVVWTKLTVVTIEGKRPSSMTQRWDDLCANTLVVQPLNQTSATHELCTRKMCACVRTSTCAVYSGTHLQQRDTMSKIHFWRKQRISEESAFKIMIPTWCIRRTQLCFATCIVKRLHAEVK